MERFGPEATQAICAANNQPLDLCLRVLEPQPVGEACALLQDAGCPVVSVEDSRSLVVPGRLALAATAPSAGTIPLADRSG